MLELSNFCHMTTFTILFELRDKFCWRRNGDKGRNADKSKLQRLNDLKRNKNYPCKSNSFLHFSI